ncbi:MAG: hypothetical protein HKP30_16925 [Myxococcales bacterium]|nr:hypothetical protein [Myxococcales bacterium]
MNDPQRLLRNSLRANGAFSTLSGLAFTFGSGALASAFGLPDPRILFAVGLGLLGFAGCLAFVSSRPEIPTGTALQIVWADLAWVVGTVPLVALGPLNGTGTIAALAIADVVLVFAILQYLGVRRVRRRTPIAATS